MPMRTTPPTTLMPASVAKPATVAALTVPVLPTETTPLPGADPTVPPVRLRQAIGCALAPSFGVLRPITPTPSAVPDWREVSPHTLANPSAPTASRGLDLPATRKRKASDTDPAIVTSDSEVFRLRTTDKHHFCIMCTLHSNNN